MKYVVTWQVKNDNSGIVKKHSNGLQKKRQARVAAKQLMANAQNRKVRIKKVKVDKAWKCVDMELKRVK